MWQRFWEINRHCSSEHKDKCWCGPISLLLCLTQVQVRATVTEPFTRTRTDPISPPSCFNLEFIIPSACVPFTCSTCRHSHDLQAERGGGGERDRECCVAPICHSLIDVAVWRPDRVHAVKIQKRREFTRGSQWPAYWCVSYEFNYDGVHLYNLSLALLGISHINQLGVIHTTEACGWRILSH